MSKFEEVILLVGVTWIKSLVNASPSNGFGHVNPFTLGKPLNAHMPGKLVLFIC